MGSITPEHYKEVKKETNNFIKNVDTYLNTDWSILVRKDLLKYYANGNQLLGAIHILQNGLKEFSNREEDWKTLEQKMTVRMDEVSKKF